MDLISRQKAIEAIEEIDWYHQNCEGTMVSGANNDEHQAWYKEQDVYKALRELPSAARWIPVTEKLPEVGKEVLITAWMPLPEPWKMDVDEIVERLKADDFVHVVRCKDCKWKAGSECTRFSGVRPFPNDFCSRGERREGEE